MLTSDKLDVARDKGPCKIAAFSATLLSGRGELTGG